MSQYSHLGRAGARRRAAEAKAPPKAKQAPAAKAGSATAATAPYWALSKGDLDRATAQAVKSERARISAVFASPDSIGRERACATLLASDHNWTAATICAQLGHLPTDADMAGQAAGKRSEAAAAVWDRVIANLNAGGR